MVTTVTVTVFANNTVNACMIFKKYVSLCRKLMITTNIKYVKL